MGLGHSFVSFPSSKCAKNGLWLVERDGTWFCCLRHFDRKLRGLYSMMCLVCFPIVVIFLLLSLNSVNARFYNKALCSNCWLYRSNSQSIFTMCCENENVHPIIMENCVIVIV